MITLTFDGLPQLIQTLQRLSTAVLPPLGEALYEEGNRIMGQSVQLVPVDTGLLRSTSHVARPVLTGTTAEVELRYGSHGLADYAALIETDTLMNHPHGGQAHYLQDPLLAAVDGMPARLGTDLMLALRS